MPSRLRFALFLVPPHVSGRSTAMNWREPATVSTRPWQTRSIPEAHPPHPFHPLNPSRTSS